MRTPTTNILPTAVEITTLIPICQRHIYALPQGGASACSNSEMLNARTFRCVMANAKPFVVASMIA